MTERSEVDRAVAALRAELGSWSPRHGPDWRHLALHAEDAWRGPVFTSSVLGAAALAVLLVVGLVVVALSPALPGMEVVRAHLVSH